MNRPRTVCYYTMAKEREACGRCSMSVVVEAATADGDDERDAERDPYGDRRIEVDERDLRFVSPGFWLARLGDRLDDATTRLTWGR